MEQDSGLTWTTVYTPCVYESVSIYHRHHPTLIETLRPDSSYLSNSLSYITNNHDKHDQLAVVVVFSMVYTIRESTNVYPLDFYLYPVVFHTSTLKKTIHSRTKFISIQHTVTFGRFIIVVHQVDTYAQDKTMKTKKITGHVHLLSLTTHRHFATYN